MIKCAKQWLTNGTNRKQKRTQSIQADRQVTRDTVLRLSKGWVNKIAQKKLNHLISPEMWSEANNIQIIRRSILKEFYFKP